MSILLDENEILNYFGPMGRDKSLTILEGILDGITLDSEINQDEIDELYHWCNSNPFLHRKEPYKSIVETVESAIEDNILTSEEVADIRWACENAANSLFDNITCSIQQLNGIFHGLLADGKLNNKEIVNLQEWIYDNDQLKGTYPYDELESILQQILKDNIITEEERNALFTFCNQFVDKSTSLHLTNKTIDKSDLININGICAVDPDISFKNKVFCLTGNATLKRADLINLIEKNGGVYSDRVTLNTDYLIVGNRGSSCWAYSCYGRKVEQAMHNRKIGCSTIIVNEIDFMDSLTA